MVEDVLTQEEQARLTPDAVIELLKAGNERFVDGEVTLRNHTGQVRKVTTAQYPKAIVLSCVDSRVPVEDVFDRGIGDVFVARVAGNFANTDILGSMEFACRVAGAKLIVVLGHEHCGAIKSAIDGAKLGNITAMLENLQSAVDSFTDEKTSENAELVHKVAEKNVQLTVAKIQQDSSVLREMLANGEIKIVGAMHDMDLGVVAFLD